MPRLLLALVFSIGFALPASAATIDFGDFFPNVSPGSSADFGEYRITAATTPGGVSAFLTRTNRAPASGPDRALFNANGAEFTLTRIDGAAFDLTGFDFARRPNDGSGSRSARSIDVIGTLLLGGTSSFNTGALTDGFQTATDSILGATSILFRPLQSLVTPTRSDYEFLIDDIDVSLSRPPEVVPLPASLPLLLAGFGMLGWLRRRQTRLI